jgi:hypothetical protein
LTHASLLTNSSAFALLDVIANIHAIHALITEQLKLAVLIKPYRV